MHDLGGGRLASHIKRLRWKARQGHIDWPCNTHQACTYSSDAVRSVHTSMENRLSSGPKLLPPELPARWDSGNLLMASDWDRGCCIC